MKLEALIWDLDGTLAETERDGHRVAFNRAFADLGLSWQWSEARYGALLHISGGRERLLHDMATHADAPGLPAEREALARELHRRKNQHYASLLADRALPLREGVLPLLDEALSAGLRLALASTTSRSNWQALVRALHGKLRSEDFGVQICGEDVSCKKPHPEAYLAALECLGLTPLQAVAFEDSPGGATAAQAAAVPVIVTPGAYFTHCSFEGCLAIGASLHQRSGWRPAPSKAEGRVTLDDVRHWHALADHVAYHP